MAAAAAAAPEAAHATAIALLFTLKRDFDVQRLVIGMLCN
jgi:hypothetical protein